MLKSTVLTIAALAVAMVACMSNDAEAFCHRYRSIPVWYGVYYPNCGPCGGCIMPYVASGCYSGYGYCGIGCGGCGYGCGYASYGCGACCVKHPRLAAHRAYKSWKRYMRGCGSCFASVDCCGGCGSCGSGCTTGGCNSCGTDSGSEAIYDGPAGDAPAMPATPDQSASVRRPLILLAGLRNNRADGSAEFTRGLSALRNGSLNDAAREFDAASSAEPDNALYHYYRALAMYDLYGAVAAAEARDQAVQAELREPIANWGKRMERVQGRARLWIEQARRDAGLVR
jgi:hypothetical protein